jgi:TDG/mug DNA glycosylase family protein
MTTTRPTRHDLEAAAGRRIPDVIAPGLDVLFCGINPGLWSAAVGHHFARPGNRFWKVLHEAGFTPEVVAPADDRCLLELGLGITNLVARSSATAAGACPVRWAGGSRASSPLSAWARSGRRSAGRGRESASSPS